MLNAVILCLLLGPVWAFAITVLWEPFELFVVSPIAAKFGIVFGYETIRNTLSDIIFDAIGVGLGFVFIRTIS
ncbi:MAG: hypothetical protein M3Q79_02200 [bacterium]|nr:hypothetical protein [bacterium]